MTAPEWKPPQLSDPQRLDLLLAQADLSLDQQHDMFGAIETKAGLYMAVASVLMAGSAALLPDGLLATVQAAPAWLQWAFLIGALGSAASGLAAVVEAMQTIRVGRVHVRETDAEPIFAMFQDPREDLREQWAARTFRAAHALRLENRKKADRLENVQALLYWFIGLQCLFAISVVVLVLSRV